MFADCERRARHRSSSLRRAALWFTRRGNALRSGFSGRHGSRPGMGRGVRRSVVARKDPQKEQKDIERVEEAERGDVKRIAIRQANAAMKSSKPVPGERLRPR